MESSKRLLNDPRQPILNAPVDKVMLFRRILINKCIREDIFFFFNSQEILKLEIDVKSIT